MVGRRRRLSPDVVRFSVDLRPHAQARQLWAEAAARSGRDARHLSFLRVTRNAAPQGGMRNLMQTQFALKHARYERELDRALAGSFPASDPPPWTLGVTHSTDSVFAAARPAAVDVVIREGYRLGGTRLASLGEAIAMVAMLPVAILIAGLPVVALTWAFTNALAWLTGSR